MKDSNKIEKMHGLTLLILFVTMIMAGFIFSVSHLRGIVVTYGTHLLGTLQREVPASEISVATENYYNSLYSSQLWTLDAFSLVQRTLGKHETRNFEVLKSNSGELYLQESAADINVERLQIIADQCKLMYDETKEYGGHFLYVQVPYKNIAQAPELSIYASDTTEEYESILCSLIGEKEIPVLDLREYNQCTEYYKTDHHWTVQSAFHASRIITDEIERLFDVNLERHEYYGDMNNYESVTYENCFLGSIGIKVGPYFTGRDDFTLYKPTFDTDITFEHYINNELQFDYSGNFGDVFIAQELLEDKTYTNKYNANMHGAYAESIINNHLAQNDYKALLITHSYGRPMAPYMCFNYSELRYLDPQKGRFNGNLVEYIRKYQPDVVIFMHNNIVNVGDGNWTE